MQTTVIGIDCVTGTWLHVNSWLGYSLHSAGRFYGVPNTTFLKEAVNALRKARGEEQLDAMQFLKILRAKIKELEDDLQETQKTLEDIQKRRGDAGDKGPVVLTPEQQAEVDAFRKRATETRHELKELRRDLRQDVESLQFWTKVVNIGAMPLLIILIGLGIALMRRRQLRP